MTEPKEPQRMPSLRKQAIIRFGLAALAVPAILFALAGTIRYWQGWLYWAVLIIPMMAAVGYLLRSDPQLLERRLAYQEKEKEQRAIVLIGSALYLAGFLAVAIDLRLHGLDQVPAYLVVAADGGVFLGYSLIFWVFKVNSYASRTIEVMDGQEVVTTGPYAYVRHPMYLGFLVMYLLTPIALGSWMAAPFFLLYIPIIVWRIRAEEKLLLRDLPGYRQYCLERPYRLLPHVW